MIESANAGAQGIDNASQARQISPPQATIIEDRRNRVVIETQNEDSGMLVLSDNYYPGWSASVDGAPAEIFRANCTMRAVKVPAGRHMVSFVFMPMTFKASVYHQPCDGCACGVRIDYDFLPVPKRIEEFTSQEQQPRYTAR